MKKFLTVIVISISLKSCGLIPREVQYEDLEVRPLWMAISKMPRDTIGFTLIDKNDKISLEEESIFFEKPYDVMLHIEGRTSRTIAFRKIEGDQFVWIGEQEIFRGPKKYQTVDGEFNEEIVMTFYIESKFGNPSNELIINYRGPDEELMLKRNLKLEEVRHIIEDWLESR